MENNKQPIIAKKTILRNLFLSALIGGFIVVTAVLPAEYGIDPSGLGKAMGFSKLYIPESGEVVKAIEEPVKQQKHRAIGLKNVGSPEKVGRPSNAELPIANEQYAFREDAVKITIPAHKGIEYKIKVKQLGFMKYSWTTENEELFLDFHGEPADSKGFYESYAVCYSDNMGGSFIAPFEGKHGWYFKNNQDKDVEVSINLKGNYQLIQ